MWLPSKVIVDGEIVCLRTGVFVGVSDEVCEGEESDLVSDLCMSDFEVCATLYYGLVQHMGNVCSPLQLSSSVLTVFSILKWFYTFCFLNDLLGNKNNFVQFIYI